MVVNSENGLSLKGMVAHDGAGGAPALMPGTAGREPLPMDVFRKPPGFVFHYQGIGPV
jgi:hypothetical protein